MTLEEYICPWLLLVCILRVVFTVSFAMTFPITKDPETKSTIFGVNPPIRYWNRFVTENAITWKEEEVKRKGERDKGKEGV